VEIDFLVGGDETPPGFPGMAHAQEHMAFRGCAGLTADQTSAIYAQLGGQNNAYTQQNITQYFVTVPAADLDVAIQVRAAYLHGIDDSQQEWTQERGAIEQEVARDLSNPTYRFIDRLNQDMFAGTPYAHDPLGTKESFDATTGEMLKDFHKKWYTPTNVIMVIVGDVNPAATMTKIQRWFGDVASHPLYGPYARRQNLDAEDEMDLRQNKSFTPLGSSMESQGRPINKNAFRRFQKFFVQKCFKMPVRSRQQHRTGGIGLLRAAVLGANDGILSTSSLVLGVAAAHGTHRSILVAGIAGLVSGGMSMAASEYVSVHSQADTEEAELALERTKLKQDNKGERQALTAIYVARGLEPLLATRVAQQLIAYDELGAYARDELGISEKFRARPIQASLAAACSFAVGAMMPLLVTAIAPQARLIPFVSVSSLVVLAVMGGLAAHAGGAKVIMGAIRVTFWGGLAMAMTAGIGWLVGAVT